MNECGYILHHDDADGWVSAALLLRKHENYTPVPINYQDGIDNIAYVNSNIYLVDFSFNTSMKELLFGLCKYSKNMVWFDHHKTSSDFLTAHRDEMRNSSLHYLVNSDMGSCAELVYRDMGVYNTRVGLPFIIKLLSLSDRWNPTDIKLGYHLEEGIMSFKDYKLIQSALDGDLEAIDKLLIEGMRISKERKDNIPNLDAPIKYEIANKVFLIANTWDYPLMELKKLSDNVGYIFNGNYMVVVSKEINLYDLLSPFGAGGHRHVVGLMLGENTKDIIFKIWKGE